MARLVAAGVDEFTPLGGPILAFAMGATEERALAPLEPEFRSVSLFGAYRADHEVGVDARDLATFGEGTFGGVYSCLLYDYFLEHAQALREAHRVTVTGGWFLTHIAAFRLLDDCTPPTTIRVLEPAPGFYSYVPAGQHLLSVRVGRRWFLDMMEEVGYTDCKIRQYVDPASDVACDWFFGRKRLARNGH